MTSLILEKFIGAGGYGSVYHGRWGKRHVAVKKFNVTHDDVQQTAAIQLEMQLLEKLQDRYIVQFYGTNYYEDSLVLIMDYAEGGSLKGAIEKRRVTDWATRCRLAQEIVRGLEYIHLERIFHRDLKSGNTPYC
ncbi:hypothetical protein BGZ73_004095 [Actinomortierella ambigua]|nr:hypothetical protein BGZ73_004095 [Actinomortierella ambigua]